MKLLLLVTDLELGGTPTVVRDLAISLSRDRRVDVQVACLAGAGPVARQMETAGIRVTTLNARGSKDVAVVYRLMRLIRKESFDTVFSFLIHANTVAAVARIFCRHVRFIQSIQTTQPWPRWHWQVQDLIAHAAEKVVVPSPSVARAARDWSHVPAENIAIIPNGVAVEDFAGIAARDSSRAVRRIGFIGRLDPIKRVGDLVEAMLHIDKSIHLDIFGAGPEQRAIEQHIRALDLQSRVTLHGPVALPQEALMQIDLLVLPSSAEGFGLVLIEAMAARIPVVATNVPGICDVVKNGVTGLLVPAREPRALARAIARLASDGAWRQSLIDQAGVDVRARFSWSAAMRDYRNILRLD